MSIWERGTDLLVDATIACIFIIVLGSGLVSLIRALGAIL